jgi:hypothetical protein
MIAHKSAILASVLGAPFDIMPKVKVANAGDTTTATYCNY